MKKLTVEQLIAHLKATGFVFQGSAIYGGLANTWDYGPLGVELKDNIKAAWWQKFIRENPHNVGIQSSILMNPKVWEASGHLKTFSDPLMDCKQCKTRHRADKLIDEALSHQMNAATLSFEQMEEVIKTNNIACPNCGSKDFTSIRQFNLMFKTFQGVVEDSSAIIYLRPETAQGMFVNFQHVVRANRKKIPFGLGQIGKSFRNEITPGNFIFRTREFEQMELEFFTHPDEAMRWYDFWQNMCYQWLIDLGLKPEHVRIRDHDAEELSHYSVATSDIEYMYPWGWDELWGIANRTDFDLTQHQEHSKQSMEYFDQNTNSKYIPYVIEPAVGVERLFLAFMAEACVEESLGEDDSRLVAKLHPALAPVKVAILPLSKQLNEKAQSVYAQCAKHFNTEYDESGSIGKRYRRQDAIGTPFCVTVDFDTLEDNQVTIRDRDSMTQVRLPLDQLVSYVKERIEF
ncbi:MAG: glycine--tRNA ligase [Erysipelotrichia bacterium]|jgi:glycyl-tRNA synthetase|nr:glycine--tRNA ligase [Erysipelotrichia bacterium]